MSDFIAEQRRSMRQRLQEIDRTLQQWETLQAEKARLEAALAALAALGEPARRRSRAGAAAPTRRRGLGAAVVELVAQRPGMTAGEIGQALEISSPHQALANIVKAGKLEKFDLPSGRKGFRLPKRAAARAPAKRARSGRSAKPAGPAIASAET